MITYTDRIITITGNVRDEHGGLPPHATVLAFPADRTGWTKYGLTPARIKTVPVASNGSYRMENIPAGNYLLVALDSADARRWQDPAFLEAAVKSAVTVTVDWADTKSQDLRVSVIK